MTEICLIRHGETDWNARSLIQGRADIPLNETGKTQAGITGRTLSAEKWDLIYSSPLKRARETAGIIASLNALDKVHEEFDLIECDFGIADGMLIEDRRKQYPDRNLIPGAEKIQALGTRAVDIITEIANRHPGKRIILVSHACLIMEALGILSSGRINGRKLQLKNLAMNMLILNGDGWDIPWHNRSALEEQPVFSIGR